MIRNAKARYYYKLFSENKQPSEFWKVIRSLGITKSGPADASLVVSLDDLNLHFCKKVVERTNPEVIKKYADMSPEVKPFEMPVLTEKVVERGMREVKSKSVGADGVSSTLLNMLSSIVVPVLTHIYNYSLASGIYPNVWKQALIKPISKTIKPSAACDFRGISLLCTAGKILDKLVYNELNAYVENHGFLDPYQSGYRKGFSTETALIKVLDDVRKGMDEKKVTIMVMVDFSSAFDMLRKDILLAILSSIGIQGTSLSWFDSYLSNRVQRV